MPNADIPNPALNTALGQTLIEMNKQFGTGNILDVVCLTDRAGYIRLENQTGPVTERDRFELKDGSVIFLGRRVRIYEKTQFVVRDCDLIRIMGRHCAVCELVNSRIQENGIAYLPHSLLYHVEKMIESAQEGGYINANMQRPTG